MRSDRARRPPSSRARRTRVREALTTAEWRRIGGMGAVVLGLHVTGFGLLLFVISGHHSLGSGGAFALGTGITAYTLGMRHAFDADHISAIDNTTRKLLNEEKRPLGVGFFFSLGHSTIVFMLAFLIAIGIRALDDPIANSNSTLHNVTNYVGTGVSGGFLYLIAILNLIILVGIVKVFVRMRRGEFDEQQLERELASRGLMTRIFGRLLNRIGASWQMYPVGVLFGLGFDTATEIGLLVIAGSAGAAGLPFYAIICLPILFAAGMSLLDTLDGVMMNFAYGWAFLRPVRKVFYNIAITGLSVAVALFIGTIEIVSIIASKARLGGSPWSLVESFNINTAGFVIVGMFLATWVLALAIWHFGRIEERWTVGLRDATERR
ncbi:MAG: HoxN/HupN/NixA family nickel/cobalt transporter [Solirubrobacteraceae bacterium]